MLGTEIKVKPEDLLSILVSIDLAQSSMSKLVLHLPKGDTKSIALDEFRARVEDFNDMAAKYKELLGSDLRKVYKATEDFLKQDKKIAHSYDGDNGKSYRGGGASAGGFSKSGFGGRSGGGGVR